MNRQCTKCWEVKDDTAERYVGGGTDVGALIPDTPEHRMAIAEISQGFEKIMERLNALLAPEEIERTLLNVTARLMLAGKPEESENNLP